MEPVLLLRTGQHADLADCLAVQSPSRWGGMLSLFVRRTCAVNFAVLATAVAGVLLASAGPARAQQAGGSITIVKTTVGLDGAFSFTSSVAGVASFSLTTANGTASRTFGNLTPGSYSFTEAGLPPEWTLTSLSCAGDTGRTLTTVNLGNRTATIGLDAGEAIICTFTNTFGEQRHRAQTRQVIANFLEHRLSLLIGQGPDQLSFLRRVPSSLWGNSSGDGGSNKSIHSLSLTSGM